MKAVLLLSGGLDSCVTASIAKKEYNATLYTLTMQYGQSHRRELESAKNISEYLDAVEHKIISIDTSLFTKSTLVGKPDEIPERKLEEIERGIPSTYVPARNTIFLSYALAYAENYDIDAIFMGANAIDYSGYTDCRPEYIEALQRVADLGTKRGVEGRSIKIITPLIELSKSEIIRKGLDLDAPLHLTWSCYRGGEKACEGVCGEASFDVEPCVSSHS